MKLIGSKLEQELREQLILSHESLFKSEEKKRLLKAIRSLFPEMKTAYIIHWIPEQGEDIYKILIDDNNILEIELDRYDSHNEPIVEITTITKYIQGLSKQNQIKLAVALDLAKTILNKKL